MFLRWRLQTRIDSFQVPLSSALLVALAVRFNGFHGGTASNGLNDRATSHPVA